ncbi:hypothetical protein NLU13_4058 [Sarocladium strictum]|uniref:Uncharacterized protein n=1 Tax=Sarocladium strictum TaxID=5046 RepID=A0AA39L8A3_SARSR|nr:hypothetical protein NLU13_4058 [Sarocladium strictum]
MGNTSSQEAPRASSRKLSKPKVAGRDGPKSRVSPSAPASNLAIPPIKAAEFSNSYLVGTVPISASQRASFDILSPGTAVFHENPLADPANGDSTTTTSEPKSPKQIAAIELSRAERLERRRSTGHGSVNGGIPLPRVPSTHGNRHSVQGVTRTPSVQTTRTLTGTRDVASSVEDPIPRSQSLVERRASLHSRSNSRGGESQDAVCNLRRNSSTPQPELVPPHRTRSETSLYPPHRRRSLIMTPGIATRAETPKLRRKASFRRSMEPTEPVSTGDSVDSKSSRHMSLPVLPSKSEMADRAPTPTEAEYKQLGGIVFGTLRITNGAPSPSPGQEPGEVDFYTAKATSTGQMETPGKQFLLPGSHSEWDGLEMQGKRRHPQLTIEPASSRSSLLSKAPPVVDPEGQPLPPSPLSPRASTYCSMITPQLPVTVRPPTPELQITSKHAAIDDRLFEEEEENSRRPESAEPDLQVIEVAQKFNVGMKSPTRPNLVDVSRKDSGYVSNTSQSSRKTLSTVDSGYSSNVSVRSVRQKHNMPDAPDYISSDSATGEQSDSSPGGNMFSGGENLLRIEGTPTPPEERLQPSISSKDDNSMSTPRTSTSSVSHSIIRLPSLRSGKSREQKQIRRSPSQDRPKTSGSLLQRVTSPVGASNNGPRMSGLRRLLSGGSRKGLATSYAVHEFDTAVPSVPTAVEEKLQGHSARFPTAPKRLALRAEPSKDSLGTILSVEDPSETGSVERSPLPQNALQPDLETHDHTKSVSLTRLERRKSARLSVSSVSGSITGAATSILSPKSVPNPRNIIRRRSTMDDRTRRTSRNRAELDFDDDVLIDNSVVGEQDFMVPNLRQNAGNSAFDQALLGISDHGRYPVPENQSWMREPYVDPKATRRHPQLRSQKSAPDVRQTMAGHLSPVFERDSVKMASRTPPPISLQTRGSKKKRGGPKNNRRQSTPGGMPQYRPNVPRDPYDSQSSVPSSSEDLSHYSYAAPPPPMPAGPYPQATPLPPSAHWNAPPPKTRRPLFGQRYSFDGHGYRPPSTHQQKSALAPMPSREQNKDHWMPNRQSHGRQQSYGSQSDSDHYQHRRPSSSRISVDGQNAPFRVLHSYNSPAYKDIPIWG